MAKRVRHPHRLKPLGIYRRVGAVAATFILFSLGVNAMAQDAECSTVKECAQKMVDKANELKSENVQLLKRIEDLEAALAQQANATTAAIEARIVALKAGPEVPESSRRCPDGSYMTALSVSTSAGGPHGIVYEVRPACRKFN
ncbi:hypothetical protein GOB18_07880 [Sinorhizobium meliloti]|nr:hypothetical protein [Sinorhizobium meliloti]MDW9453684.1 hypothetical protein [Sinorhizobium meliloti]